MSFTFTNYAAIPPQESALSDAIGKILGGYTDMTKARFLKPSLEEELQKAKLFNQYYGPNMESQIGLRGAQAGHLGALTQGQNIKNQYLPQTLQNQLEQSRFASQNPLMSMPGMAGQIGSLMYLKQHPELLEQPSGQGGNEPMNVQEMLKQSILQNMTQKPRQNALSPIGKLQQELEDIEAGYYPGSQRKTPIESEERKEELRAPYREKLGGIKSGEHYIYDPDSGEKIGVQRRYTEKEKAEEEGRHFFNEIYPIINNGLSEFTGKNSIKNFNKYVREYGKNPESTKKIDDLYLAQKLISAGVVKEAATLGAGKTNMTFKKLEQTFPKSDIPNLIQRAQKEYLLPSSTDKKAGDRFNEIINRATNRAQTSVPYYKNIYFNKGSHENKPNHGKENDPLGIR